MKENYLAHHGIKGQKWGVRRFQNADGSYTNAGKKRYSSGDTYTASNGLKVAPPRSASIRIMRKLASNSPSERIIADKNTRKGIIKEREALKEYQYDTDSKKRGGLGYKAEAKELKSRLQTGKNGIAITSASGRTETFRFNDDDESAEYARQYLKLIQTTRCGPFTIRTSDGDEYRIG